MTHKPPTALDALWEEIPTGPAPVEDLIAHGRVVRRRRRVVAAGVLAAAVVVIAGVLVHGDRGGPSIAAPSVGTRYVGIGHVVVAVPVTWVDAGASCNTPVRNMVFFPYPVDCVSSFHGEVSSVAITRGAFTETGTILSDMTPAGSVDGHRVVESPAECSVEQGQYCRQVFGVPDERVYFTVSIPRDEDHARAQVEAIRRSLTVLSQDRTAVPFVTPGSPLGHWESALRDAGFAVRVRHHTCPPTADCGRGVGYTTPAAGLSAPTGSTVTIEVQD
jgi:hypothetical protein